MATLTATCDDCGKVLKAGEIYADYDYVDRCYGCKLRNELVCAEDDYESKRDWVKKVWIKDLKERKAEINRIKKELEKLNT